MICRKCGKNFEGSTAILVSGLCMDCLNAEQEKKPYIMHGWVCPVCGAGMSPSTNRCPCVDKISVIS